MTIAHKARNVVLSCRTRKQIAVAERYIDLLARSNPESVSLPMYLRRLLLGRTEEIVAGKP